MSLTLTEQSTPTTLVQAIALRLQETLQAEFTSVWRSELMDYVVTEEDCDWSAMSSSRIFRQIDQRYVLVVPVIDVHSIDPRLANLMPIPCLLARSSESWPALTCPLVNTIVEAELLKNRHDQTQHKLEHSLYQITASFEELTWLRSLAEHFEICSLTDGLARVGQATLPTLRQLIYAQELYLFGPGGSEAGASHSPDVLAQDGEGLIDQPSALALFARLTSYADEQLIVWNTSVNTGQSHGAHEIRNCMLVPVTKADERHGWLMAINKCMPIDELLWDQSAIQDQNLIEFGTSEAGLMTTMAVMLATHAKNVNLLCEKEELLLGVLRALVSTIDAKDAYTGGHSDRVARFSRQIAERLGLSSQACEEIYMSGLLHDIGKIGVPDAVLGKPERLTDEEFEQIKRHPMIGYEILKALKPFAYLLPGVLHHHESFDGSGYPQKLAGEEISLMGRIIAVADSYDAMTSDRTYRPGMPIEKAVGILRSGQGKQWDPCIVEAFLSTGPHQPTKQGGHVGF